MRDIRIHIAATIAALAPVACTGDRNRTGARTQFRDSAGIRIVENARPPEGSRLDWRLGPEPLVSIGRMEGEDPYLFDRVFGAAVLSDGRIGEASTGVDKWKVPLMAAGAARRREARVRVASGSERLDPGEGVPIQHVGVP